MEAQQGDGERWEDEKGPAPEKAAVDDSVAEKISWKMVVFGGLRAPFPGQMQLVMLLLYCR
jgi:hypothetical protein